MSLSVVALREIFDLVPSDVPENGDPSICVSGPQLAEYLLISDRRIRQLCELGMPKAQRGRYKLQECVGWYVTYLRGVNRRARREADRRADIIRERRWNAQADILELQLAKMTARFASQREYFEALQIEMGRMKRLLRRLPAWIAHELKSSPEEHASIARIVEEEWEKHLSARSHLIVDRAADA